MHELSIAMNIVEIAEEEAAKASAKKIFKMELEIGTLSGIVIDALEFALDEAVKGTILENTERKITEIKSKAKCCKCNHEFEALDFFTPCPQCASFENDIIEGKDMKIKSLVI